MWMILSSLAVIPKIYYLLNPFFTISFTQDLGMLKYFLGVKVMRNKQEILLSQRKYVLDMLYETEKLGTRPCSTPMDPNVPLTKKG